MQVGFSSAGTMGIASDVGQGTVAIADNLCGKFRQQGAKNTVLQSLSKVTLNPDWMLSFTSWLGLQD